jgi:multiple sugar transport system permease protein
MGMIAKDEKKAFIRRIGSIGFCLFIAFVLLICIFPFIWTLLISITPYEELAEFHWLPSWATTEWYRLVLFDNLFLLYIGNSFLVAFATTLFCISLGSLASYALARLRFKGKAAVLIVVLLVVMFPQITIVGPLADILMGLNLINSYLALILPYTMLCLPLTIWILTTFFNSIPRDLEDAARVDGCTRMGALTKVIFPLAAPGIVTTGILVFIFAWNEFMFANTFITEPELYTITVGIANFGGRYTTAWGELAGAAIIVTVPLIILVLIFQKKIVQGLTAGGVKG